MKFSSLIFVIALASGTLLPLTLTAQVVPGVDTITCKSVTAISDGTEFQVNNTFILYGHERIDWIQSAEDEPTVYTISEIVGEWSELNQQGQLEFKVNLDERSGSLFFYRDASALKLRIDMKRGEVNLVPFEFLISDLH